MGLLNVRKAIIGHNVEDREGQSGTEPTDLSAFCRETLDRIWKIAVHRVTLKQK
jgi:hypothetical protein